MAAKEMPGITIFWDQFDFLLDDCLMPEQTCVLLAAIRDYSRDGVHPEFEDKLLSLAWKAIRPRIDAAITSYSKAENKKRFGGLKKVWDSAHPDEKCVFSRFEEWEAAGCPEVSCWLSGGPKNKKTDIFGK